jgi:hypothetical protein
MFYVVCVLCYMFYVLCFIFMKFMNLLPKLSSDQVYVLCFIFLTVTVFLQLLFYKVYVLCLTCGCARDFHTTTMI